MFPGHSAQFLAVLETVVDHHCRPLTRSPPHPVTELDEETVTDVFDELLCAGTDLVLAGLGQLHERGSSHSLMELATEG